MARNRSIRFVGAAFAVTLAFPLATADATVDRTPGLDASSGLGLLGTADDGTLLPEVSADGRFVVFHSEQSFVVPGDTNGFSDVFLRDRQEDTLEVISRSAAAQANGDSSFGDMSSDGRFVVFHSDATNLGVTDTNDDWDIYLLDRDTGDLERVSETSAGGEANGPSFHASVSDDGRYVAFHSLASNLSSIEDNTDADIYVKDRQTGELELISTSGSGGEANGRSFVPDISADGRFVAFESEASNLVGGDTNAKWDIFVRDRSDDTTERVSLSAELLNPDDNSFLPKISADGRYVAFESFAENLIFGDTNGVADVYVYDRTDVQTTRASEGFQIGVDSNDRSLGVSMTDDGQQVAFQSWASNLVDGDENGVMDVFLYTLGDAAPIRVSEVDGVGGNEASALPAISGDGSIVVFESLADNLGPADDDGFWDAFVYEVGSGELAAASPIGEAAPDDVFDLGNTGGGDFDDVPDGVFYTDGVRFLANNGITTGTSPSTYSPDDVVTRAQMATFLFRLAGSQWTNAEEPFTDVFGGQYFFEPVKWAYESGITTGTSATTYSPDDAVSRAQMAVFLWRLAGEPAASQPHGFSDVAAGSFYAEAVAWLAETGLTTGTSPTTFSPEDSVTRAQMAAFLLRLVEDYEWTPVWVAPQ